VTLGLLNALEFHNNVDIPSRGGFVKKDASWNTTGRVGLYKVKTQSDFARLMYQLCDLHCEFTMYHPGHYAIDVQKSIITY